MSLDDHVAPAFRPGEDVKALCAWCDRPTLLHADMALDEQGRPVCPDCLVKNAADHVTGIRFEDARAATPRPPDAPRAEEAIRRADAGEEP